MLKTRVEQLLQIFHGAIWDGNLISKKERDMLVTLGLVAKSLGYNIITPKGIECLYNLDLLDPRNLTPRADGTTVESTVTSNKDENDRPKAPCTGRWHTLSFESQKNTYCPLCKEGLSS